MTQEPEKGMIILENSKPYCPYCVIGMKVYRVPSGPDDEPSTTIRCANGWCPNFDGGIHGA